VKSLLLSALIFISGVLFSQEKNSFVAIGSGVSIPVGNYAAKNLDYGCFTTTGLNFNIEGAWFFLPYLGIGGQVGVNIHPVDVQSLGWERVQADPFLVDVTIRSDSYQMITGALGLYAQWSFWKKLSLQGKLLGGMMWAKSPYQLHKPTYFLVETKWFEITSARDRNLAIIAGAGLQYDISRYIGLKLSGDYTFSKMVFGFRSSGETRYENRDIGFVNVNLGLIIIL